MSSLRSLPVILSCLVLLSCGSSDPVQSPAGGSETLVQTLGAVRNGDRVDVTFTLTGDPVDRVEVHRQVEGVDDVHVIATLESPVVGSPLRVSDSTIYSGHEHAYRVMISRSRRLSDWVSVGRVPGPTLTAFPSAISGVVSLSWTFRPTGVERFRIVRHGGGTTTVVHQGPSDLLGLADGDLDIATDYVYQIESTFGNGLELVSWERPARLYDQVGSGIASAAGAVGETTVLDVVDGLSTVAVFDGHRLVVGVQTIAADFGHDRVFEDQVNFAPGSTSGIGIPPGGGEGPSSSAGSDVSPRFVVAGILDGEVSARVYTRTGQVLRSLTWPAVPGERRTFMTIAHSPALNRDVVFLATESRVWELSPQLQSGTPHPPPTQTGVGVAYTRDLVAVLQTDPPAILTAPYSRDAKNGEPLVWTIHPLPPGTVPVHITAPGTDQSDRLFVLDSEGGILTRNLVSDRLTRLRLPSGHYTLGRLYMSPPRPIAPEAFEGFRVIESAGWMRAYEK